MEISKVKLGHTFHGNTEEISGLAKDYLLTQSDTIFFVVELKIYGGYEIHEFSEFRLALLHLHNHNTVFRFVEYTNIKKKRRIFVVHNVAYSNKLVGYQNFYGIGDKWNLYINSKGDIVVQHIESPKTDITVRFRNFPEGVEFYLDLSCLIYGLTNYKLDSEKDIRAIFQQVKNCVTK